MRVNHIIMQLQEACRRRPSHHLAFPVRTQKEARSLDCEAWAGQRRRLLIAAPSRQANAGWKPAGHGKKIHDRLAYLEKIAQAFRFHWQLRQWIHLCKLTALSFLLLLYWLSLFISLFVFTIISGIAHDFTINNCWLLISIYHVTVTCLLQWEQRRGEQWHVQLACRSWIIVVEMS